MQDEKLAQAYQSVVDDYLSKGYNYLRSPRGRAETTIRMVPSAFPYGETRVGHNQSSGSFQWLSSAKWKEFEQ